jgi:hypothetical protein
MKSPLSIVAFLAPAMLAPAVLAQQVWTVSPQGPLTTIQAAVNAAADGDLILVQSGTYPPFDVQAKSLTLVGDPAAEVFLFAVFPPGIPFDRGIEVRNLAANQRVVVRGIDFRIAVPDPLPTAEIANCSGAVLFEDCEIAGSVGAGVSVSNSNSVTFVRCLLRGGGPFLPVGSSVFQPNAGVQVLAAQVYLFDSAVVGSQGKDWTLISQSTSVGGPGLVLKSGFVLAQGASLQGGRGGQNSTIGFQPCIPMQAGGAGVVVEQTQGSSRLVLISSDLAGGLGGQPLPGCPEPAGATGPSQVVTAGQVDVVTAEARSLGLSGLVREQQSTAIVLAGQPGDLAWLFVSMASGSGSFLEPSLFAPHLDLASLALLPIPGLNPAGVLVSELTAPNLPPGVAFRALSGQALFLSASGELFLSGPSELRIVDQAF